MSQVTDKELLQRLKEQRDFLISELSEYERGKRHFAYKIAATLRTIFYKSPSSFPILPDLSDKYGYQLEFKGRNPPPRDTYYLGFKLFLGAIERKVIQNDRKLVSKKFDEYWNEIVFAEPFEDGYTRIKIVLIAANKLGGTHSDPRIDPDARHLAKAVMRQSGPNFEEVVIGSVVYETGVQALMVLEGLIPYLDSKIVDESR